MPNQLVSNLMTSSQYRLVAGRSQKWGVHRATEGTVMSKALGHMRHAIIWLICFCAAVTPFLIVVPNMWPCFRLYTEASILPSIRPKLGATAIGVLLTWVWAVVALFTRECRYGVQLCSALCASVALVASLTAAFDVALNEFETRWVFIQFITCTAITFISSFFWLSAVTCSDTYTLRGQRVGW